MIFISHKNLQFTYNNSLSGTTYVPGPLIYSFRYFANMCTFSVRKSFVVPFGSNYLS